MIFLVRHAKAGHRSEENPDDSLRPLTASGRRQAEALAEKLAEAGATGPLLSSQFTRCVQTLEPLARRLGGEVLLDKRLAEAKPVGGLLELIETTPDGSVLCSHGDMIPDVIDALVRRGCKVTNEPNWKKASVWVLTRDDDGVTRGLASWPAPDV